MKAKAGFLMLLIALVSFTGFGQTTSDLTENSTTEVHDVTDMIAGNTVEASVSVVAVTKNVESSNIDWEEFRQKVKKASHEAVLETNRKLSDKLENLANPPDQLKSLMPQTTLPNPDKYDGDVGWQITEVNYAQPYSYHNSRKPRDGIRC